MDWDSDLDQLLEERVEEAARAGDEEEFFWDVAEELEDHTEVYDREGTVKHGTAAANLESIAEEGALVPGKENSSVAGERADQHWVRMTHLFPLSVKYGREAFPTREKLVEKANSWAQFLGKNIADWSPEVDISTEQGRQEIRENPLDLQPGMLYGTYYSHVLNSLQKLEQMDSGINDDPVVVEAPLRAAEYFQITATDEPASRMEEEVEVDGSSYPVLPGKVVEKYELLEKTEDELQAVNQGKLCPRDPMQESRATRVNLDADTVVYVPHEQLQRYRDSYAREDFQVMSLDAKSLQHELRMQERYSEEGKLEYRTPWDIRSHMIDFKWDKTDHDSRPQVIDISG